MQLHLHMVRMPAMEMADPATPGGPQPVDARASRAGTFCAKSSVEVNRSAGCWLDSMLCAGLPGCLAILGCALDLWPWVILGSFRHPRCACHEGSVHNGISCQQHGEAFPDRLEWNWCCEGPLMIRPRPVVSAEPGPRSGSTGLSEPPFTGLPAQL